jgi:hypothetical protein
MYVTSLSKYIVVTRLVLEVVDSNFGRKLAVLTEVLS